VSTDAPQSDTLPTITSCPVKHYEFMPAGRKPLDGFHLFDELRGDCPAFRSEEAQGYYVLTDTELILDGLQHPELFSNASPVPIDPNPSVKWIPMMIDPPEHTVWRKLLGPLFSPGRIAALEPRVRERCTELVDEIVAAGAGEVDFINAFARQFPTTIFMEILGLPADKFEQFMAWEAKILHGTAETDPDRAIMATAMFEVMGYFQEIIGERRATPETARKDVLSEALTWEIDGEPIPDQDLLSFCLLLFMAGLDTVTAQLSYAFLHLSTHPDDRDRLVADPALIPTAVEEFLRVYPIVQTGRKVTQDFTFHGLDLKEGDMVVFPLAATGRDPGQYANATTVDLDREVTRHVSFGAGPHRCLGSHLARQELKVALEVWHEKIPNYAFVGGSDITEHAGGVYGLDTLPMTWTR
jgi:cytochrome P450